MSDKTDAIDTQSFDGVFLSARLVGIFLILSIKIMEGHMKGGGYERNRKRIKGEVEILDSLLTLKEVDGTVTLITVEDSEGQFPWLACVNSHVVRKSWITAVKGEGNTFKIINTKDRSVMVGSLFTGPTEEQMMSLSYGQWRKKTKFEDQQESGA